MIGLNEDEDIVKGLEKLKASTEVLNKLQAVHTESIDVILKDFQEGRIGFIKCIWTMYKCTRACRKEMDKVVVNYEP